MILSEILRRATPEERLIIWDRVIRSPYASPSDRAAHRDVVVPTGPDLRRLLADCRVDRAVLVLCLARETSPCGLRLLERTAECRIHRDEAGLPPWMYSARGRDYDRRVLSWIRSDNPREPGTPSHRRFGLYVREMTVDQLVRRGLRRYEVRRDVARGNIELREAAHAQA